MSQNYTEQDTERARERELNSAGMPTQSLSGSQAAFAPMGVNATLQQPYPNTIPALVLIGIGLVLLVGRGLGDWLHLEVVRSMVLFTIASGFLFFSFWKRLYGLLIPGCILAGLSMGVMFADITDGVSVLWGLSLGFLSILLLGRRLFNMRSSWPIYPAIPLFCVGVIIAISNAPTFFAAGLIWLPLALIGAGLFLGWGRRRAA